MKRLFSCIRKPRDDRSRNKLDKQRDFTSITSPSLNTTQDVSAESLLINLPNEIIIYIFRFLSARDLCNVSLVSRSFKTIADHDDVWKPKCNTSIKLSSKSYKQIYIEWTKQKALREEQLLKLRSMNISTTACVRRLPLTHVRRPDENRFESIGGFHVHPKTTKGITICFTVNIDKTARQLISLLEKASPFREHWKEPVILKQMIQRYYRFMQLKASNPPETLLIPTLDIEMVWQTHLLRPEMYRNDCLRLFRRIVDHSLILKNDMEQSIKEQAFLNTCQLYEQRFGAQYCSLPSTRADGYTASTHSKSMYSYWDETHFEFSSKPPNDYENPFSFTESDIILDLKWFDLCKNYMSNAAAQVSDIDLGSEALKRLKKSYERFLYMAAKYPLKNANEFIPPTYAIDIIWHSHMQEPLNYEADCLRLVGYIIYHDPWPVIEDNNMKKSCDQVNQIWRNEFQRELKIDHL